MPSGGHNKKPRALHLLHGTYDERRQPKRRVAPKSGPPRKPRGLSKLAGQHWDHIVKTRRDWLDASDGPALLLLCETWEEMRLAASELKADRGYKTALRFQMAAKLWTSQAAHFGLDPVSRERLGIVDGKAGRSELERTYLG